jgi:FkbM family methyltransferase
VFRADVHQRLRETTILKVLPEYFKGRCAIDVGAATGQITMFLREHFEHVWAFEAVPEVFQQTKKLEQTGNVTAVNLAIGNFDGWGKIYVDHKRLSNSGFQDLVGGPSIDMRVNYLDRLFLDTTKEGDIGFIKIDVEGTEWDVLRGAEAIIKRDSPAIMCEIFAKYSFYPEITIFDMLMKRHGYRCGFYSPEGFVPVPSPADGVQAVKTRHEEHDGDFLFWKP